MSEYYQSTKTAYSADSYAPLRVLLYWKRPGDTKYLLIPTQDFFQQASIDQAQGTWKGTINLYFKAGYRRPLMYASVDTNFNPTGYATPPGNPTSDDLFNNIVVPGSKTEIVLKFGWDQKNEFSQSLFAGAPAYYLSASIPRPSFTADGVAVTLEISGAVIGSTVVDRGKEPRWFSDKTASEIVREIADANGWTYDDSTIEDSCGMMETMKLDADESHVDFIVNKLQPMAVNGRGESFTFYFDTETKNAAVGAFPISSGTDVRKVYFNSVGRPKSDSQTEPTQIVFKRAYKVFADQMGEVISFTPSDNSMITGVLGGGNATVVGFDAEMGEPIDRAAGRGEGIENGGCGFAAEGQEEKVLEDEDEDQYTRVPGRTAEETEMRAKQQNAELRINAMSAEFQVKGTHEWTTNDWIRVDYYNAAGKLHYLSGLFRVKSKAHEVSGNSWTSSATLLKMGTVDKSDSAQKDLDAKTLPAVREDTI
jgi:hypothetical protein